MIDLDPHSRTVAPPHISRKGRRCPVLVSPMVNPVDDPKWSEARDNCDYDNDDQLRYESIFIKSAESAIIGLQVGRGVCDTLLTAGRSGTTSSNSSFPENQQRT